MREQKYKDYAQSRNGKFVGFVCLPNSKHAQVEYICAKQHSFISRLGFSRWCPTCAIETRRLFLIERNNAKRVYSYDPIDINAQVNKFGAEYLQMDYTPKSLQEKLLFKTYDGSINSVCLISALKGIGLGQKKKKTEAALQRHIDKAKNICKEAGYTFIDFIPTKNNSFNSSTIVFQNKYGTRTAQGCFFIKGKHRENSHISRPVREIEQYLKSLGVEMQLEYYIKLEEKDFVGWDNYYDLKLKERDNPLASVAKHKRRLMLDIFIPSHNIAIEYHSAKWHDSFVAPSKRYECSYKLSCCDSRNIHLIQIWEHEWSLRKDQIKGILRNKLGLTPKKINARDCNIEEIDRKEASMFLTKYHLQGSPASIHKAYGMFHYDELVAVVSIKKEKKEVHKGLYLDRLVIHPDMSIRGSLGKFNKFLLRSHAHLYTLIDLRLHKPTNWVNSGWKLERIMNSSYSYFDTKNRKHYDKRKFRAPPKDFINTTEHGREHAYVKSLGNFCKLWNCGRARLVLEKTDP